MSSMISRSKLLTCAMALSLMLFPLFHALAADQGAAEPSSPADLHIKFAERKPVTPQCRERARQIVDTLRKTLAKYRDYKAGEAAGYKPYYTNIAMPVYHFASKWRAFKELIRFDPAQPTALLYKKAGDGYQLIGAMYYAPGRYSEDELDQRLPLCVARWHRQINICLPPSGKDASDDPRFTSDGTIATEAECKKAGGHWYPNPHGWMAEVYPFEKDPKKIWAYRPD